MKYKDDSTFNGEKSPTKEEGKLWYGGTSIEWSVAKEEIRAKFAAAHLTGFLEGTEVFIQPTPNEENWITPCIERMEECRLQYIDNRILFFVEEFPIPVGTTFETLGEAILNIVNEPVRASLRDMYYKLCEKNDQALKDMALMRASMMSNMNRERGEWEKRRRDYEKRNNECLKIFEGCFPKNVLSQVTIELGESNFRGAFEKLDRVYNVRGQGTEITELVAHLHELRWNPKTTKLEHFIDEITKSTRVLERGGLAVTDPMRRMYLYDGITRGISKDFTDTLNYCNYAEKTWNETIQLVLQKNRQVIKERLTRNNERTFVTKNDKEKRNNNNKKQAFLKGVICHYCGNEGHVQKFCFKKLREDKEKEDTEDNPTYQANAASNGESNKPDLVSGFQNRMNEIQSGNVTQNNGGGQVKRKKPSRANVMIAMKAKAHENVEKNDGKVLEKVQRFQVKCIEIFSPSKKSKMDIINDYDEMNTRNDEKGWIQGKHELPPEKEVKNIKSPMTSCSDVCNNSDDCVNYGCRLVGSDCKINATRVYENNCERTVSCASTQNSYCEQTVESIPTQKCIWMRSDKDNINSVQNGPTPVDMTRMIDECNNTHHGVELKTDVVHDFNHDFRDVDCESIRIFEVQRSKSNKKLEYCCVTLATAMNLNDYYNEMKPSLEFEDEIEAMIVHNDRKVSLDYVNAIVDMQYEMCDFIFDSGSSRHMCGVLEYFDELEEEYGNVALGDGNIIDSLGVGRIGILENVLYVPELTLGLISMSELDKEGYSTVFKGGMARVLDDDNRIILQGERAEGLYVLDEIPDEITLRDIERTYVLDVKHGSAPKKLRSGLSGGNELELLHQRWGHLNEQAIKNSIQKGTVIGSLVDYEVIKDQHLRVCPDCNKGKMTELPRQYSETDYSKAGPIEFIATDDYGPFKVESFPDKWRYFDLFSFKSSRWLEVRFKRFKNDFYNNFEDVIEWTKYLDSGSIKRIQSDNAGLYEGKEMLEILRRERIQYGSSTSRSSSQNGWIEREIRSITEKARTIMLVYDCPLRFWPFAIEMAKDLLNRSPRYELDWITPYEKLYGEKPDISNLVPFYAPGVAFIPKEDRDHKMSPKAYECRMLGFDEKGKNSYLVYIPL
jgi:hypothetical protein